MTQSPNVRVERDGHVTTVTIDRAEAKNACTGTCGWRSGKRSATSATRARASVVLTGAGDDFCAGADLGGSGSFGSDDGGEATVRPRAARPAPAVLDAMRVLGDVGARRARVPGPGDRQGRRGLRRRRLRPRVGRRHDLVLGPRTLLRHLRQARAEPRLRDVVAAPPTHRRAQGEGARVHGRDDERRTRLELGIRERGGPGGRARRRGRHGRGLHRRRATDRAVDDEAGARQCGQSARWPRRSRPRRSPRR